MQERLQRFGGFLAGMVIPNIGAFIAWGLITAFVIPTGWTPNAKLAKLVGPMIQILLPLLIAYTGGRMVHGQRGAVVAAVATMGIVIGADVPMLLDNFSAGIIGGGMALVGVWIIGPVVQHVTDAAGHGVNWLISNHLIPLA